MTEEENEAIETLQYLCSDDCISKDIIKTIVNLIKKLQKEKDEILNSKVGVDLSFDDYIPKDKIRKLEEMWNDNIWNATDEASEEKAEMIRDVYRGLLDE